MKRTDLILTILWVIFLAIICVGAVVVLTDKIVPMPKRASMPPPVCTWVEQQGGGAPTPRTCVYSADMTITRDAPNLLSSPMAGVAAHWVVPVVQLEKGVAQ